MILFEIDFDIIFNSISAATPTTTTTTQATSPAGPTPGPVRNVTVTKTTLGVRITWNPPADTSIPITHYMIEYKSDTKWLHWGPIKDTTVYEG